MLSYLKEFVSNIKVKHSGTSNLQAMNQHQKEALASEREKSRHEYIWLWLKKPVPTWVALVSGNMDQNMRFAPPV